MTPDQHLEEFSSSIRSAVKTVGLFSFISSGLMLVVPLFTLQVLDRVLSTRSIDTLLVLTSAAVFVVLVIALLYQVRDRIMARVVMKLDTDLGPALFRKNLQENAFTGTPENNYLISDIRKLRYFLTGSSLYNLFELPWTPLFIGIVFAFNPVLGAVVTMAVTVMLLLAFSSEYLAKPKMALAEQAQQSNRYDEDVFLRNSESIEAMGMSSQVEQLWQQQQARVHGNELQAEDSIATINATVRFTRILLNVMLIAVGAWLVVTSQITTGVMIASLIIGMRAIAPLEAVFSNWRLFNSARSIINNIRSQIQTVQAIRLNHPITAIPSGGLTIDNLVYVPVGSKKPVIKGINYHLPEGHILGVTGHNGSGKSTLLRLAMGLHRPTGGSVRLGDLEVSELNRELFGYHIGYLKQDADLFPGTVAENISRLQPASLNEVIDAAKFAGAHELIMSLPDGYSTRVMGAGFNLSGGQRQMIALARAVFGKPQFLVLDEPTAMLDLHETEKVAAMLGRLRRAGITTLVATHQSRLLKEVNDVLILKSGQIDSSKKLKVA
jgi:PrtD family type I secretion system ABC transporter